MLDPVPLSAIVSFITIALALMLSDHVNFFERDRMIEGIFYCCNPIILIMPSWNSTEPFCSTLMIPLHLSEYSTLADLSCVLKQAK